ncbi:3-hydroxybutyryl-CoA dehydrogenase [Candidatus Woesearchaeota archaeon]|nr:3-hydroxybutyryl-CoA dehydrogenase [Candidatus Woesearchaeota archaeon]
MKKIAVIGAGTMGHGIAQVFAMRNYPVNLIDINEKVLKNAEQKIKISLKKFEEKNKIDDADKVIRNINFSTDINKVRDDDLIIEAIVEKVSIKKNLYQQLDDICRKDAIFASNTSSIPITKLAEFTERPGLIIGMHFFNPPQLMKLVEIIVGEKTSDKTREKITMLTESLGRQPITVIDSPAFVTSRLIMIMINEAVECVSEKIATIRDIDKAMKLGMNHPMGPLELADLVGLDVVLAIMETMYEGFDDEKYKPSSLLVKKVKKGEIGKKTGKGFYEYKQS